ncbi:hypothetical protein HDU91_002165, partial [Kappamyces sp. JEL0680]
MKSHPRLLVAATGSVATIKLGEIVQALAPHFDIKIVLSKNSLYFCKPLLEADGPLRGITVYQDADEWGNESYSRGDPVLHIELRKWADVMLVAPLSANTLAKMATGICDNLVT